ncbi:MAG: hypothetical protein ACREUA_10735, partial [Burkholderiales bacterium]
PAPGIRAPFNDDKRLRSRIQVLRKRGEVVVVDLPRHGKGDLDDDCDRELVLRDGRWVVVRRVRAKR